MRPKSSKFPADFPASREFGCGDGLASDCLVSQPVWSSAPNSWWSQKPRHSAPLSGSCTRLHSRNADVRREYRLLSPGPVFDSRFCQTGPERWYLCRRSRPASQLVRKTRIVEVGGGQGPGRRRSRISCRRSACGLLVHSNLPIGLQSVRSPLMAASATFALKDGVWFRRGRLLIVSPDSRAQRARCQAETPLIALCSFPRPARRDEPAIHITKTSLYMV